MANISITSGDSHNIITFQNVSVTDSVSTFRLKLEEIVLDARKGEKWVLDLSAFKQLDSSSISILTHLHRGIQERGGRFALAGVSSSIHYILRMSELLDIFTIYKSIDDLD